MAGEAGILRDICGELGTWTFERLEQTAEGYDDDQLRAAYNRLAERSKTLLERVQREYTGLDRLGYWDFVDAVEGLSRRLHSVTVADDIAAWQPHLETLVSDLRRRLDSWDFLFPAFGLRVGASDVRRSVLYPVRRQSLLLGTTYVPPLATRTLLREQQRRILNRLRECLGYRPKLPDIEDDYEDYEWLISGDEAFRVLATNPSVHIRITDASFGPALRDSRRLFHVLRIALLLQSTPEWRLTLVQGREPWRGVIYSRASTQELKVRGSRQAHEFNLRTTRLSRGWRRSTETVMEALLESPGRDQLLARVHRMVRLFDQAETVEAPFVQLILLVSGLECIVGSNKPGSTGVGARLRDGMAWLLGATEEERLGLTTTVQRLYRIRSAVVHAGSTSDVSGTAVGRARSLLRHAVLKLVRVRSHLVEDGVAVQDRDQRFLEALDAAKFGGKAPALLR